MEWTPQYLDGLDPSIPGWDGPLNTWMGWTPQYLNGLDPVGGGTARVDRQQRGEQLVQGLPPLCPAQVVDQGGDATLVKND